MYSGNNLVKNSIGNSIMIKVIGVVNYPIRGTIDTTSWKPVHEHVVGPIMNSVWFSVWHNIMIKIGEYNL